MCLIFINAFINVFNFLDAFIRVPNFQVHLFNVFNAVGMYQMKHVYLIYLVFTCLLNVV